MLKRKKEEVYAATIEYRREVRDRKISVNRHLRHLYPFMNLEKAEPQEQIAGLDEDGAAGTTAPDPSIQPEEVQDEVSDT